MGYSLGRISAEGPRCLTFGCDSGPHIIEDDGYCVVCRVHRRNAEARGGSIVPGESRRGLGRTTTGARWNLHTGQMQPSERSNAGSIFGSVAHESQPTSRPAASGFDEVLEDTNHMQPTAVQTLAIQNRAQQNQPAATYSDLFLDNLQSLRLWMYGLVS